MVCKSQASMRATVTDMSDQAVNSISKPARSCGSIVLVRHVIQYDWYPLVQGQDTTRNPRWAECEGPHDASVLAPADCDFMDLSDVIREVARRHGVHHARVTVDWFRYDGQHTLLHRMYWDDGFLVFREIPRDVSQSGTEMRLGRAQSRA